MMQPQPPRRLSLLDRQRRLLEERGFCPRGGNAVQSDILPPVGPQRTPSGLRRGSFSTMSVASDAPSIGAGDDTAYWDYQHRQAEPKDLGHLCRECKKPFTVMGQPISERRGARIALRYHRHCFSNYADPRSQPHSSHYEGHLAHTQSEAAPLQSFHKMRTSSHFSGPPAR
eukprot:TRINITY_DN8815_c0_g1_i1.p1 TRINITY_DN8815_c0_g1~~TRINITY_DN8815_c0_g1_i1.p1  ORF type:complete len:198 (+),score=39.17 TRINITY_DN8815_c0_g1_i1:84-596(+)